MLNSTARRYDALIFDLDGTLVDTGLDIALSANFVRQQHGLSEVPIDVAKSYVGDGVLKLMERILGHDEASGKTGAEGRPVSSDEVKAGLDVFMDHYRVHVLDNSVLYPGVEEVLERCRPLPLFLATNKPRGFTDQLLIGLGLGGVFDRIVAGDETPARKPDPQHLRAVLVGCEVAPSAVMMIGDSPNDVIAAQRFGAVSVGCTFGFVAPEIVARAQPDYLVSGLLEVLELIEF